ncbi:ISNCY family transposase [Burkholderia cenocepacia]|uniref:ISNCY family transposase n=3 Tax=Burkholderia cenocepacia TaxID=95486 RepID=UPI001AA0E933|nr:ISNCY family transposase [Burkholderia cenocepacia]MBO1859222.1 ISNCY family transposase [Burkholderia cenocepacia]MCO8450175.1 ISNCY family transposase [Burkholderia cenocepacia]MDN7543176.1 ISNCY family transposase [Burkholderia cenocepacia]MDR5647877.1 ISNCY family transposase [Burkholderia cenocepacia]MDR8050289.1 ISNCY family transposase [Burkholderia cenocepacia]
MHRTALVTLNMRELDRLKVIQAVVDTGLKPGRAAERLGLTVRQIERLVTRYRESGAAGLTSRKRGRPGNRRLDEELARRALTIIRERYADFGPTLACEKLSECHGIQLAKETVRRLMTDAGLWAPRRQRPPKVYQPRARRACLGELIQIDGSDHRWFEERAPACTLLVYVDDATSRLMMLHFTQTESTFSYFEATRAYIECHGKPGAFYSDKYSVFRNTTPGKTGNRVTHFGRAMYELNIDTFCANSSPAKGRVERAHLTLQDRLVKEMRLRGINTVAGANAYAPSFMAAYNARFAKPPKSDFNAHRPLRADENLDLVMTWREPRKVTKSLTVQYDRVMYLLDDTPENRKLIDRTIEVWEYPDGRIELRTEGRVLPCRQYDRLAEIDQAAVVEHKRLSHVLQVAQAIQSQRDNSRIGKAPSRTNRGDPSKTNRNTSRPDKKKQREITHADLEKVIVDLAERRQAQQPARKPGRRSAKTNAANVSALPDQDQLFDTA